MPTWHNAGMKFRTGLIVGLGTGYVLGARAGRERYEYLLALWQQVRSDERVGTVIDTAADATEKPRRAARSAVETGLRSASEVIQERSTGTDG